VKEKAMQSSITCVDTEVHEDIATVKVRGDTTIHPDMTRFHQAVETLAGNGPRTLVVDLSTSKWLGASMLGALVAARNVVTKAGGRIRLSGLSAKANRILTATRLDALFDRSSPSGQRV
jgi:anti-anti-sigma factor